MTREQIDILYVAAGTTTGLRRADEALLKSLRACGASTKCVTSRFYLPPVLRGPVRRSPAATDLHECLALRRSAGHALAAFQPRAIIYGSTHAALLARSSHGLPFAIRFDTPARLSRVGRVFGPEHHLERRRFRSARLLLPTGIDVAPLLDELLPRDADVVPLPIPIDPGPQPERRDRIVVTYAGSPSKKGLDTVVRAWAQAQTSGRKLVIAGIAREQGLRYLADQGLSEPAGTEWPGLLGFDAFRALTQRAEIYVAASRYENYGIAQLEAMIDGALLVTLPSAGPFAALPIARHLAPQLVAETGTAAALATSLEAAGKFSLSERVAYSRQARELLRAHSYEELEKRVRTKVLPSLLP